MTRRLVTAILVAVLVGAGTLGVAAQTAPVTLAFATLSQGTAWYVYGATIAGLLRDALPPGSNVDVKPFSGGVGNAKLVAKNEAPLALSFTVTNRWAYQGQEAYDAKLENLRGLVGGLDQYYLVALASRKLDANSLKDVKDRKLPVKLYTLNVGSLGELGAKQLLREYGITYDDVKGWGGSTTHQSYKIIVDAFKDGRADLLIAVITPKHPSITEIATFSDVKFLNIEPERVKGLAELGYVAATMAADTFKGQTAPVSTVGFPTVLITNTALPEPIAYTITKTVIENKDALVRGHAGLAAFDPKTAWKPENVGLPLHPGAERAYREKGWMK
ncbi:MAG TPA: TAXI family TRAP transporter solute-binding subunit [Candidatus Tectomicrobia bacterium]|nr:TAXI family TRAP transporter solute-binding subunit [Candidatus Tectomicrobia bacterium]